MLLPPNLVDSKFPLNLTGLRPEDCRPTAREKFLFIGERKFYMRGVTYGPFRPDEHGREYGDPQIAAKDFAQMTANGINTLRTYTVPPRCVLHLAGQRGLRVMAG